MKNIGLICTQHPSADRRVVSDLAQWLRDKGCKIHLDKETATQIGEDSNLSPEEVPSLSDLVIVLGGDGTLLNVAGVAHQHEVPILGVNLGNLGFLTETTQEDLYPTLQAVLNEECEIEHRMLLNISLWRNDSKEYDLNILNDVVINKGVQTQIVNLSVLADDRPMISYRADGLIIATPTGSTAYSLSAGGPIIHPTMQAFVLSPICPFALTNRPIVVPDTSKIKVQLNKRREEEDVRITLDGKLGYFMETGDILEVKKAKETVKLVQAPGKNYYQTLRKRLHWGTDESNF